MTLSYQGCLPHLKLAGKRMYLQVTWSYKCAMMEGDGEGQEGEGRIWRVMTLA